MNEISNNVFSNSRTTFSNKHFYFKRARIHNSLKKSLQNQVVAVVAGAGYGKTQVVYVFLQEYKALTVWLQITMLDNIGARFWENLVKSFSISDKKIAANLELLGLPETVAKFDIFLSYILEYIEPDKKYVVVYDDFHLLHEKRTLRFIEKFINAGIPNLSFILISRSEPEINTAGLLAKEMISVVNEKDLCFSKNEMVRYYEARDIYISPQLISEIYKNTGGWIMAIRLIELSVKKGVAHEKYALTAMKFNINKLMESDIYSHLSKKTKIFLAKLSLFDSLPMELVEELSSNNKALVNTILQINSFIRFDSFSNIYYIHHLFLDFLRQKQDILTQSEKMKCYQKAADWYASNNYIIDAITYYEKAGDYEGILKIALFFPHASQEEGALVLDIMDRAPAKVCEQEPLLAMLRARAMWFVGNLAESMAEREAIIKKVEALPRTKETLLTLSELYTSTGLSYYYLTNLTNNFHFADYFIKAYEYVGHERISMKVNYPCQEVGTYVCRISSEKKEDMETYTEAVKTAAYYAPKLMPGCMCGTDDLMLAEFFYFKNSLKEAEKSAYRALYKAREHSQHTIAMRAIFYLLRICLAQGSYPKLQDCKEQLKLQLENENSLVYKTLCDMAASWFFSIIRQSDKVANWVKSNSEQVCLNSVASGSENLAKIKYYLCEKKYHELLVFLEHQESVSDINSFLFGKIAIAATKAVCLYHTDEKDKAITALEEAYLLAEPNALTMQFVELGNSMVALTKFALKSKDCTIPDDWLKNILRKSSTYAKRISHVASEYKRANYLESEAQITLTQKEMELLNSICHGLSRAEIASSYGLSPNHVKNRLQAIYAKLGAQNAHDAIRIAFFKKLIK